MPPVSRQHPHGRVSAPVGEDWYGRYAEAFTHLVGRPAFLVGQTVVVLAWVAINLVAAGLRWDPYPFILLNLVFSLEAAYAAPLILLAQTRQADRERAVALADAAHRDALARESLERQWLAADHAEQLRALLESNAAQTEQLRVLLESNNAHTEQLRSVLKPNTPLTEETRRLAEQLEGVAGEIYRELRPDGDRPSERVGGPGMSGASGKPQPSPTPLGSDSEPARNVPAFRRIRKAKRLLIARPLRSHELEAQRLRKWLTLPIFSSVAYATETALAVIVSALVADRGAVLPVSVAIAALLAIVALSYTWIVRVYSTSGGSYVVRLLLLELRVILASVPYRLD